MKNSCQNQIQKIPNYAKTMLKTKHKQKVLLQVIKLKGKVLTTMFSSRE
jgi:hypothetical protein